MERIQQRGKVLLRVGGKSIDGRVTGLSDSVFSSHSTIRQIFSAIP